MAIKTTTWHPDTCGCVVTYTWDDELTEDERQHLFNTVEQKCSYHIALDDSVTYDTVTTENTTKNIVYNQVLVNHPELTTTDKDGNVVAKDGALTVTLDEKRQIVVNAPLADPIALTDTLATIDSPIPIKGT